MALPDLTAAKLYLRVQHTADDVLITSLLARAYALAESYLRRPIVAAARDYPLLSASTHAVRGRLGVLYLPLYPVDAASLVVKDADGATVAAADYALDEYTGTITAADGISFDNGPYTVTATAGLDQHPQYAALIEPVIGQALLDLVADLYQRRNPAAQAEGSGGGVYTQWQQAGLPQRVREALDPWKLVTVY